MVKTIKNKILKIEELKGQQSGIRIKEQLNQSQIQQKILLLKQEFIDQVCSENPTAFWKQKKHEVSLPYKEDYQGKPRRSKAIPMNVFLIKASSENLLVLGIAMVSM